MNKCLRVLYAFTVWSWFYMLHKLQNQCTLMKSQIYLHGKMDLLKPLYIQYLPFNPPAALSRKPKGTQQTNICSLRSQIL